jgi:hypothetical protein
MEQPLKESEAIAGFVGMTLGGRYQLDRVLGAGGMGAVFEGRDLQLGRSVAIKVIRPGLAREGEYSKRFLREAQTASKIRHRNVVMILDYGVAEGLVYSVMEFLVGQDLEELLRGQPDQRLPWAQACGLLIQIASGLRAAHGQGVIHRDIKPANCFLTTEDDEPVIKVVDFGIAKLEDTAHSPQLTSTGNVLGTPSYTAPEIVMTNGPASPRSDVYSLGVAAYRMLTGHLPFTGTTAFEVMFRACKDPVPPLRGHVPELPAAVEALVVEMLAKEPGNRPADMGVVRQRLQALGREGLGAQAVVIPDSRALRIEPQREDRPGEVVRTEVIDSGQRELSGRRSAGPVVAVADRTEVIDSGQRELSAQLAVPAVVEAERTEVIDSGQRELSARFLAAPVVPTNQPAEVFARVADGPVRMASHPPVVGEGARRMAGPVAREGSGRKAAGWLVAGAVVMVALGGVGWWMMDAGPAVEGSSSKDAASEVATIEPEQAVDAEQRPQPIPRSQALDAEAEGSARPEAAERNDPVIGPADDAGDPSVVEPPALDPPVPEPNVDGPETTPKQEKTREPKAPAGLPSDAEIKRRLARKIKNKCAAELGGEQVTVLFFATAAGEVSDLSATPWNAAGKCAERQVAGTKLRPRSGDTPIKIVVR